MASDIGKDIEQEEVMMDIGQSEVRMSVKSPSLPDLNDAIDRENSFVEFPKKDVHVKIDKKDLVFIYEIDDIIQGINANALTKELKNANGEIQILHNFSRIIRQYAWHWVVEKGDFAGGLFIEGFWKSILATLDAIIKWTRDLASAEIKDKI